MKEENGLNRAKKSLLKDVLIRIANYNLNVNGIKKLGVSFGLMYDLDKTQES